MSMESTRLAQSRPSAMAVTTKEAPRRQSPQAYKLLQGASSACKREPTGAENICQVDVGITC